MTRDRADALILATSATVWDVLTDVDEYAVWGSGITDVKGEIRDRSIIRVRIRGHGDSVFRLRVRLQPSHMMTWTFRLPLGLLTLRRSFSLSDYSGITRITVEDTAHGPLRQLMPTAYPAVSDFVDEVKFRAELLSFHVTGGIFPNSDDEKPS